MKLQARARRADRRRCGGSVVFFIVILLAILGAGVYFLIDSRRTREAEAREFAREVIKRLAVQHDLNYLHSVVAGEHYEFNAGRQEGFIESFKWLGVPEKVWQLTGDVTFESHFFAPVGHFKCLLSYPQRHATVEMKVSCPHGPWRLDTLGLTWERTPEESDALKH